MGGDREVDDAGRTDYLGGKAYRRARGCKGKQVRFMEQQQPGGVVFGRPSSCNQMFEALSMNWQTASWDDWSGWHGAQLRSRELTNENGVGNLHVAVDGARSVSDTRRRVREAIRVRAGGGILPVECLEDIVWAQCRREGKANGRMASCDYIDLGGQSPCERQTVAWSWASAGSNDGGRRAWWERPVGRVPGWQGFFGCR